MISLEKLIMNKMNGLLCKVNKILYDKIYVEEENNTNGERG